MTSLTAVILASAAVLAAVLALALITAQPTQSDDDLASVHAARQNPPQAPR